MDRKIVLDIINLHPDLEIKQEANKTYIRCLIRKNWLVLQPEELVRQLLILHLITALNYPKEKIACEKKLEINGLVKRFDLAIYNQEGKPYFLIECKGPKINLDQKAFDQIESYNRVMGARLLLITNGLYAYCLKIEDGKPSYLLNIPSYCV